jgi:hypothetical protein
MQPRTLVAALAMALVALLASQGSAAYYYGPTVRAENRNLLIQWASSPLYDPAAPNTIVYGTVDNLQTATLPQSLAIEAHLDFLERYDVRLAAFGQDTAATRVHTAPPNDTNQPGEFIFREWGYTASQAVCPTLTPLSAQDFHASTNATWPAVGADGRNHTAGKLRTTVSQHSVKGSFKQTNFLWRYDNAADPDPLSHPDPRYTEANDEWRYGGPKNAGWDLMGIGYVDYYCRIDANGNLYHNSAIEPMVKDTALYPEAMR